MLITVFVRTCLRKVGKMQVLRRKFLLYLNANFFIAESVVNSNSSAPAIKFWLSLRRAKLHLTFTTRSKVRAMLPRLRTIMGKEICEFNSEGSSGFQQQRFNSKPAGTGSLEKNSVKTRLLPNKLFPLNVSGI